VEERPKKQKARLATGLRREKSFWANARMARETLLQSGVYERSANQSRKKTDALLCCQAYLNVIVTDESRWWSEVRPRSACLLRVPQLV
jgi:hypothetical protein